jgi:hypothetical protein
VDGGISLTKTITNVNQPDMTVNKASNNYLFYISKVCSMDVCARQSSPTKPLSPGDLSIDELTRIKYLQ